MSRIHELEKLIVKHKALYYQGRPELPDDEYDALEEELKNLDPNNETLNVVGSAPSGAGKVKHKTKMLSLDKTYKFEDLIKWKKDYDVLSTFKIDGVSCSLIYRDGSFVLGKTRGDGATGENITEKIKWMSNIPKKISLNGEVEVRGEIFCYEESFFHLSDEMVSLGLEKPTSMRNIVAGLISRKENIELCRYLTFNAFELISDSLELKSEQDKMKALEKEEFDLPPYEFHKNEKSLKKAISEAEAFMSSGDYQIDGLVITYNNTALHEELGATAHHPRYKIAFKFRGVSKKTKILNINWGVSRNGVLTPVAEVEPVELSGAVISRVTLHNFGMVRQYNLKQGDVIEIIRSGEVIPKFQSVIKSTKGEYQIPSKACESCKKSPVVDDIRLKCINKTCPDREKENILNFIQKMGIDDLSSKRLDELLRVGLVKSIPDLYDLRVEDLMTLDKVKDKLANKLVENIQNSKKNDLVTFLSALGISGGAYNKCEKVVLAGHNTLAKIKNLTQEKLIDIESFAEKSSMEFLSSLKSKHVLIESLEKKGFRFKEVKEKATKVSGKKICITGSLSRKRAEIEKDIRDHGGIVVGSVSKNTDYLVCNAESSSSSKYKKATTLEVTIIDEKELYELFNP